MRAAIVVFPGSNRDGDVARALRLAGAEVVKVWHADTELPAGTDLAVLPGGFSYGDYLRCGAIAGRAAAMDAVRDHAAHGGLVLGICNGFQILCESHLLPGALIRNDHRHFICRDQKLKIERTGTTWTNGYTAGDEIVVPLKNGEGGYVADEATLDRLEGEGQVVARYLELNPNGSYRDIAGVSNASGTVVGLMPHPEHAVEDGYGPGTDGLRFFTSALQGVLSA